MWTSRRVRRRERKNSSSLENMTYEEKVKVLDLFSQKRRLMGDG